MYDPFSKKWLYTVQQFCDECIISDIKCDIYDSDIALNKHVLILMDIKKIRKRVNDIFEINKKRYEKVNECFKIMKNLSIDLSRIRASIKSTKDYHKKRIVYLKKYEQLSFYYKNTNIIIEKIKTLFNLKPDSIKIRESIRNSYEYGLNLNQLINLYTQYYEKNKNIYILKYIATLDQSYFDMRKIFAEFSNILDKSDEICSNMYANNCVNDEIYICVCLDLYSIHQ